MGEAAAVAGRIAANVNGVIRGQQGTVRKVLAALASGGHVLLEDYPGTGKTTLAKCLARSVTGEFRRVQFTPDLLPTDILGVSVFDQKEQAFKFHRGPVFTNILLADEINRASPRTQSALLEAMSESQASVDGQTYRLPDPFFVIATQNPVESHGTYPLPEAQMDRFMVRLALGYVSPEEEVGVLSDQQDIHPLEKAAAVATTAEVLALQAAVRRVRVADELKRYAVELAAATRREDGVALGAGPRASLALMRLAQALALADGKDFVGPDQVQEAAVPVVAHRLMLDPQARFSGLSGRGVVEAVLKRVPAPA
jgi:MoxR-like ATPase